MCMRCTVKMSTMKMSTVTMSKAKCRNVKNVDNGNGESQNGEHCAQYVATVATPVNKKRKKLSYLYVYFNIVSNAAQKVANLSVRIVVNEISDSRI